MGDQVAEVRERLRASCDACWSRRNGEWVAAVTVRAGLEPCILGHASISAHPLTGEWGWRFRVRTQTVASGTCKSAEAAARAVAAYIDPLLQAAEAIKQALADAEDEDHDQQ